MSPSTARVVVWSGGAALAAAAVAAIVLTIALGEEVFAARLIAGLTGCL